MISRNFISLSVATLLTVAPLVGSAQTLKTFKYDQYPENIYEAVDAIQGKILQYEMGFVQGEAFGAIFRPSLNDYPLKIVGIDVIFGGPQGFPDLSTTISIEIYRNAGQGPAPANPEPDFAISTQEFWNMDTNEFGIPIKGNIAYQFDFNYDDPDGAPPLIDQGNVLVALRFSEAAMSLETEWSVIKCVKFQEIGACGCQPVSMILDPVPTTDTNVMSIVWPQGNCSGNTKWVFVEDIKNAAGQPGIKGDVILRLRVESSDAGCFGSCDGLECGDDGCGESCGSCDDGYLCQSGQCVDENPVCTPSCAAKECGPDGCDGSCGTCDPGFKCQAGSCIEEPPACTCVDKDCGDDGCGNSCGTCGADQSCEAGTCVEDVPACSCDGLDCGDDGCGSSCGTCGEGELCEAGACVEDPSVEPPPPAELRVDEITPAQGYGDEQTSVSILGGGFLDGASAKLGGTDLIAVQVTSEGLITATVPKGLTPQEYTLIVVNPNGQTASLAQAFNVLERAVEASGGGRGAPSSSCAVSSAGAAGNPLTAGAGLALLLLLVTGVLRMRRAVTAVR